MKRGEQCCLINYNYFRCCMSCVITFSYLRSIEEIQAETTLEEERNCRLRIWM